MKVEPVIPAAPGLGTAGKKLFFNNLIIPFVTDYTDVIFAPVYGDSLARTLGIPLMRVPINFIPTMSAFIVNFLLGFSDHNYCSSWRSNILNPSMTAPHRKSSSWLKSSLVCALYK